MTANRIAVFGSSQTRPGTDEWTVAVDVGKRLGNAGYGVVTGGYGGTMEAVSLGAGRTGVPVTGVTAPFLFPGRSGANRYVTELVEAPSLAARIGTMMDRTIGSIALPGSIGTATELLLAWNTNHIVRRNGGMPFPSVAVGKEWRRVGLVLAAEVGAGLEDLYWADDAMSGLDWLFDVLETMESEKPRPRL